MGLTRSFAERYNLTVMMVTHNMSHAIEYGNRLLMMDSGEIVLDIGKEEKSRLTIDEVVQRFRDIKKRELANDQMLLNP
jgi:putative ABC transport system ATP-binding protein